MPSLPKESAGPGAATSPLDDQISDAEKQVEKQKEMIIELVAEGKDVGGARRQLDAMVED